MFLIVVVPIVARGYRAHSPRKALREHRLYQHILVVEQQHGELPPSSMVALKTPCGDRVPVTVVWSWSRLAQLLVVGLQWGADVVAAWEAKQSMHRQYP